MVKSNKLYDLLSKKIVVLDGAMGTMLQTMGYNVNKHTELLCQTNPKVIEDIHYRYLMAGADIVYTNTFGANPYKLANYDFKGVVISAIECARRAVKRAGKGLVCFDMGTIGELMEPMGELTFDKVYEFYKEIVIIACDKVDMFVVETMSDLYELKCAVLAIKENSDLPCMVSMSFDAKGRTFSGCSIEAMVSTMQGLGVDVLGLNCGLGPKQIGPLVERLLKYSDVPVIVKPNAGLPVISNGQVSYDVDAEDFAETMLEYVKMGVNVVGGCCGTDESYIKLLANEVKALTPSKINLNNYSLVSSGTRCVEINQARIVGERINPTGKKIMKQAILDKDISYFQKQAVEQSEQGAEILDINMGVPNIDEPEMVKMSIKAVQSIVDCPLQIDSSDPKAIEMGLRYYNGKPLVNSVNGNVDVMEKILPLVRKYGAMVVGLTLDKNGIPKNIEDRLVIARRIVNKCKEYNIPTKDIVIDCLTLTLGAEQRQAMNTLIGLKRVKEELGVKTMLGISNISYGLPSRQIINSNFLTMALTYGLDLAIVNPNLPEIQEAFDTFRLIKDYDKDGQKYCNKYSAIKQTDTQTGEKMTLQESIIKSVSSTARELTVDLITKVDGLQIINNEVIPALNEIGKRYEEGTLFLPQLIRASEVAKMVCDIVKASMPTESQIKKAKIVICSVEGDIHDIGKNIVKTVLLNYGYEVIDIGRDVAIEKVIDSIKINKPEVVCLSALMTTTVANMKKTIEAIKLNGFKVIICVGGAVLTENVAKEIGADIYSKDPSQLVKYLESKGL
ncbi:MAG: homocysteine S-methyltransferase family protein [Clostridia bacterium]